MILPIGHQESSVRRLPWVSFAIMAVCLAAFLATQPTDSEPSPDAEQALEDATAYWRNHAYLEADPEIRTRVAYDVMPNQREQYLALLEDKTLAMAPRSVEGWSAEQVELDRLTDLALGRVADAGADRPDDPYRRWGLIPSRPSPQAALTHIFMHAGWIHLLSNLFMFFLAGPPVEDRLGRPLFGALFVAAGVFAGLFWAGLSIDSNVPLVGASGAIAGILGAFCVRFWAAKIRFAYFFLFGFRPYFGTFEAKAWLMLPLWFGNELLSAWLMHRFGFDDGVAYWAHVGGFVFGAAAMAVIQVLHVEDRYIHPAIESKVTMVEGSPVVEAAYAAREQGDVEGALAMLQAEWERSAAAEGGGIDRDAALALWDVALASGRPELGAGAMAAVVRLATAAGERSLAVTHWLELTRHAPLELVDPATLIRLVPELLEVGNRDLAVLALRHVVDPANRGLTAGLALRTVDLARELDPPSALRAARAVLASKDLHEAKRAKVEGLIEALEAAGNGEVDDLATEVSRRQAAFRADRAIEIEGLTDQTPALGAAALAGGAAAASAPPPLPPRTSSLAPPPLPVPAPPPVPAGLAAVDLGATAPFERIPMDVASVRFPEAKVVEAAPTRLDADVLRFAISEERRAKIEYEKIEAIAMAVVEGIGAKPLLVVDLLLNWTTMDEVPLRVIRFWSNAFDPRVVVPGEPSAMAALRTLVRTLLERSGAVALPSADALAADRLSRYSDLSTYQREVLQVGS